MTSYQITIIYHVTQTSYTLTTPDLYILQTLTPSIWAALRNFFGNSYVPAPGEPAFHACNADVKKQRIKDAAIALFYADSICTSGSRQITSEHSESKKCGEYLTTENKTRLVGCGEVVEGTGLKVTFSK